MPQRSFQRVYDENTAETFSIVSNILKPKSGEISREFYSVMLETNEATIFLKNEQVEKQLSKSFTAWAKKLFCVKSDFDSESLANFHLDIGKIHARIGVPMRLVDYGMQVVKDYCFRAFLSESNDIAKIPEGIIYINNILDTALTTINQSYLEITIDNERNAQLLRLKMAATDLNVECERIKSELLTWSRDILTHVLVNSRESYESISNIYQTNFGLWISHKAVFYFSDYEEFGKIKKALYKLDELCMQGLRLAFNGRQSDTIDFASKINSIVNEIKWLLTEIIERNNKENQSKDPLTNLLSRRYIDNILKREVEISIKQNQRFSILMIDLDSFKVINDTYGHSSGDMVIREVAKIVMRCIRPNDFCFRYGGEEIAVVLTNMTKEATQNKAENIRRSIENNSFIDKSGKHIQVTVSVGAALHQGHPDYQKTIDSADKNLYEAKNLGKNIVVI